MRSYDRPVLDSLTEPWCEVLRLGWEAYGAGTIPVGAVVADETGAIVSRGRNRIFDGQHDGQLAGTRLAHAEINALISLPADRMYTDWTLYSLLEPCHLCLGAAQAVRMGSVRYAAPDAWGGAHGRLQPTEDHLWHPLAVEGPLDDELGRLGELLLVAHYLWRVPDGNVTGFYERTRPDALAAAAELPPPRSGGTLQDLIRAL
jgi:tRNA(adenine34) deaminase